MAKVKDAFGQIVGIFRTKGEVEDPAEQQKNEAIAMDTFRSRVSAHRSTFGPMIPQAPGFDYVNWKPYGKHRIHGYNDDDFSERAYRLGPYVRCVVESGCEGLEERRWAGLAGQPPPYVPGRSRFGTPGLGSRSGSREFLG